MWCLDICQCVWVLSQVFQVLVSVSEYRSVCPGVKSNLWILAQVSAYWSECPDIGLDVWICHLWPERDLFPWTHF